MYLKILDSLINMDLVNYVTKRYDDEDHPGKYTIHISLPNLSYIDNHFDTKEEADELFETIRLKLEAKIIS